MTNTAAKAEWSPETFAKISDDQFNKFKTHMKTKQNLDMGDVTRKEFVVLSKIGAQLGTKGIESFMKTGEVPAIKLSHEEMELLKGGGRLGLLWEACKYGFERACTYYKVFSDMY